MRCAFFSSTYVALSLKSPLRVFRAELGFLRSVPSGVPVEAAPWGGGGAH
jgi:hypothetical protein